MHWPQVDAINIDRQLHATRTDGAVNEAQVRSGSWTVACNCQPCVVALADTAISSNRRPALDGMCLCFCLCLSATSKTLRGMLPGQLTLPVPTA